MLEFSMAAFRLFERTRTAGQQKTFKVMASIVVN
jgi:hypothetical protein